MNRSVIISYIVVVLSVIGFFDATYLTAEHYLKQTPPCFITTGCEQVTTSQYAVVAGVPVALAGSVYYLALFVLAILFSNSENKRWLKYLKSLSGLGLLATLYLVYLQIFVIHAICTYCMVSAITTTLIFGITTYLSSVINKHGEKNI